MSSEVEVEVTARVAAIVLAAGSSSRMGATNKLLLEVDGTPMVKRVCQAAVASRARPVVVVTGHQAERVGDAISGLTVGVAHNADFSAGMSTSIRCGIEALPDEVDGVLFVLADMPWIEARHLDAVISAFAETETGTGTEAEAETDAGRVEGMRQRICAPCHRGQRGNPVLWGAHYLPLLRELRGDRGARSLLDEHVDRLRLVETDDGVIIDIDTPGAVAAHATARRSPSS